MNREIKAAPPRVGEENVMKVITAAESPDGISRQPASAAFAEYRNQVPQSSVTWRKGGCSASASSVLVAKDLAYVSSTWQMMQERLV